MTEKPYFCAERLCKTLGSTHVAFSAQASRGTMTAIVGPSGSGKTTVLRMISGLLAPDNTDASIMLDGQELIAVAPQKRGIGMVFQSGALFSHLRVVDNVAYGLRCAGMRRRHSREIAESFLERFGLTGFARRWPESLSGGEAQRVSLARTLIVQPKLVLFDEPLSALDAPLRKRLAADILRMQADMGFTGIMVTHDLTEAQYLASRIIIMKEGSVYWSGGADQFDPRMMEKS